MSLFNEIAFSQYSGDLIKEAIQTVTLAVDPNRAAQTLREKNALSPIAIKWETLHASNVGSDIFVDVEIEGNPQLFTMRVSTSTDPLPNSNLHFDFDSRKPPMIRVSYKAQQGERIILTALETFRRVAQQHVDFINQGIMRHNATLSEEIDRSLRVRRASVDAAAKLVDIINEEQQRLVGDPRNS